jgi:hypothetical protein
MTDAGTRIIANAITHALRGPWHVDAFDYRGNKAGMTSPFRLTANQPGKAPHLFVERFVWGITDPDVSLDEPAHAWLLTQHVYEATVNAHVYAGNWPDELNGTALPYRRAMNRHGRWKYRRSESFDEHAALVAYALARAARVTTVPAHTYREAFPVDLGGGLTMARERANI